MLRPALVLVSVAALGLGAWWMAQLPPDEQFSAEEKVLVRSLWIGNLEALARDPSNRVADDDEAAQLGRRLFFDTRLSANGGVSCATCHKPDSYFTDGLPTGQGLRTGDRNACRVDTSPRPRGEA